jgi:hypothetical protein
MVYHLISKFTIRAKNPGLPLPEILPAVIGRFDCTVGVLNWTLAEESAESP